MKKVALLLFILFSNLCFADASSEIQKLMYNYLSSIKNANEQVLKESVSSQYFQILNKDQGLKKLFKLQKKDGKKIIFDMKFQKFHKKKDYYFVNIKDKKQKEYDHYWFVVHKKDGKFIIEKEQYLD